MLGQQILILRLNDSSFDSVIECLFIVEFSLSITQLEQLSPFDESSYVTSSTGWVHSKDIVQPSNFDQLKRIWERAKVVTRINR